MPVILEPGREYLLKVRAPTPIRNGYAFLQLGFSEVRLLDEEGQLICLLAHTGSDPVELLQTPLVKWAMTWPLAVSALGPVEVPVTKHVMAESETYDMRFLTAKATTPSEARRLLESSGFDLVAGPVLLHRHIHHPSMPGELFDWIARGIWRKVAAEPGTDGLVFEQIAPI